jgi:glyoxylase-like metal-dependent hydrolase (beta-lactamase superfamily II)
VAAVIDSCLDFDSAAGRTLTDHADQLIAFLAKEGLTLDWILETHVHADHLSAAPYLRDRLGGRVAIGSQITAVQHTFGELYNAEHGFRRDGSQFDHLFDDGEAFQIGAIPCRYVSTPGHTPACGSYVIDERHVFVGDTMFMHDAGTARADFPGGDARQLYRSIHKILDMPEDTTLWICHDYKAPGRDAFAWKSTVGEQRAANPHVRDGVSEDEFVAMREAKDKTLATPKLLIPASR